MNPASADNHIHHPAQILRNSVNDVEFLRDVTMDLNISILVPTLEYLTRLCRLYSFQASADILIRVSAGSSIYGGALCILAGSSRVLPTSISSN